MADNKLAEALRLLKSKVAATERDVSALQRTRVVPRDGRDGKDGAKGADGVSPDPQAIITQLSQLIPAPIPGRDGATGSSGAVGSTGAAGADGVSPDPEAIIERLAARIPAAIAGANGKNGRDGKDGKNGRDGKDGTDGAAITDIKLEGSKLAVWVDGVKRIVGTIKTPMGAFTPGGAGGGGAARTAALIPAVPLNEIVVNKMGDFPTRDPDGRVRLKSFLNYRMGALFPLEGTFICEANSSITGPAINVPAVSYDGTDPLFETIGQFNMQNLNFSCPNAPIFNHLGPAFVVVSSSVCSSSASLGTVASGKIDFQHSLFVTDGSFAFSGTDNIYLTTDTSFIATGAFDILDLGTATFADFKTSESVYSGPPGAVAISGLPNSGNMQTGVVGQVLTTTMTTGGIVPFSGVDPQDAQWNVMNSPDGAEHSRNAADAYLTGGAETITITTPGVFVEIGVPTTGGVSWASDLSDRFTFGADGVMTYIGVVPIDAQLQGRATVEKVGGGADELEVQFAKNWTSGPGIAKSKAVTENTAPTTVPIGALVDLAPGDNIRAIFANNGGTSNIIASVTSLEITGS
jgi:hypothetical protein